MEDIQRNRELKPSEGAHLILNLVFLLFSGIIKTSYEHEQCAVNLPTLISLIYYGLVVWLTYLMISILARYKNEAFKMFFNVLDIIFAVYQIFVFIYGNLLYFDKDWNCFEKAPVSAYFTKCYLYLIYWILTAIIVSSCCMCFLTHFRKK